MSNGREEAGLKNMPILLYGKLEMGKKNYYIEYSWSICDVKIDDFTEN